MFYVGCNPIDPRAFRWAPPIPLTALTLLGGGAGDCVAYARGGRQAHPGPPPT